MNANLKLKIMHSSEPSLCTYVILSSNMELLKCRSREDRGQVPPWLGVCQMSITEEEQECICKGFESICKGFIMFNHGIYLGKKEMQQRKLDGNQHISCQNDVKTYACGLPKQANWKDRRWWSDSRIFELRLQMEQFLVMTRFKV